jgi:Na+-transporting NADH:ubiquinone oxidoreductase subunit NqrB
MIGFFKILGVFICLIAFGIICWTAGTSVHPLFGVLLGVLAIPTVFNLLKRIQ